MADRKEKPIVKVKPLSEDEKAKIVHEYLGVHPKYFIYTGQRLKVDIFNFQRDGYNWRGWRQEELRIGNEWRDEWIGRENG
jgi:hypothetical protein